MPAHKTCKHSSTVTQFLLLRKQIAENTNQLYKCNLSRKTRSIFHCEQGRDPKFLIQKVEMELLKITSSHELKKFQAEAHHVG